MLMVLIVTIVITLNTDMYVNDDDVIQYIVFLQLAGFQILNFDVRIFFCKGCPKWGQGGRGNSDNGRKKAFYFSGEPLVSCTRHRDFVFKCAEEGQISKSIEPTDLTDFLKYLKRISMQREQISRIALYRKYQSPAVLYKYFPRG